MKDNAGHDVKITYFSSCKGDGPLKETNKCDGLKVGDIIHFSVNVLVKSCPKNRKDWNQQIKIYPVGINETLTVDLEMLCDCGCERPGHVGYEIASSKCNGHGTYKCGICECDGVHFGRKCECSK